MSNSGGGGGGMKYLRMYFNDGRRHDSVAFLGHRVKKADCLKIVNAFHAERGIPSIKSVTTPYNRGQAKRLRSNQGVVLLQEGAQV